jgi:hypothetical protein
MAWWRGERPIKGGFLKGKQIIYVFLINLVVGKLLEQVFYDPKFFH